MCGPSPLLCFLLLCCRQVLGTLQPLLIFLVRLNASVPGVARPPYASGQDRLQPVYSKMELLSGLLAKLDALPPAIGLPLQEPSMTMLLVYWQVVHVSQERGRTLLELARYSLVTLDRRGRTLLEFARYSLVTISICC